MRRIQERGSVLIIVLWIAFGLVALALYFAHSMTMALRTADNRVAGLEAEQAAEGAARYASNVVAVALTNLTILPGTLPSPFNYESEAVPVGDAIFWLLARETNSLISSPTTPVCGLADEGGKLNLNTATAEMLQWLPRMTPELAGAIIDWRDADSDVNVNGGAEDETYMRLTPPYRCKNAPFESVEELRLVYGMDLDMLYGEDANLNGVLDLNENDADESLPFDNRDSRLEPGLFEYLTIYTSQPATGTNVNDSAQLQALLVERFGDDRANQINLRLRPGGGGAGGAGGAGGGGAQQALGLTNALQFFFRSGMTPDEFALIESDITFATTNTPGLVNVNTASEAVLACIPGIGPELAPLVVAYRQANPALANSVAWVAGALNEDPASINLAGPYLTGRSYQYAADVVALGHFDRGYRRVKYVFDTTTGMPKMIARQDLSSLGWALGPEIRRSLQLARKSQ